MTVSVMQLSEDEMSEQENANLELARRAVREGIKIREKDWTDTRYIFFNGFNWLDEFECPSLCNFEKGTWTEYQEPEEELTIEDKLEHLAKDIADIFDAMAFREPSKNHRENLYNRSQKTMQAFNLG